MGSLISVLNKVVPSDFSSWSYVCLPDTVDPRGLRGTALLRVLPPDRVTRVMECEHPARSGGNTPAPAVVAHPAKVGEGGLRNARRAELPRRNAVSAAHPG